MFCYLFIMCVLFYYLTYAIYSYQLKQLETLVPQHYLQYRNEQIKKHTAFKMFIHGHFLLSYCVNLALTRKSCAFDEELFLYP